MIALIAIGIAVAAIVALFVLAELMDAGDDL